jgi:hypothetical protein
MAATKRRASQVDQTANKLIDSIPPVKAVRENLSTALHQVQLLRVLQRVAERKERQAKDSPSEKRATNVA